MRPKKLTHNLLNAFEKVLRNDKYIRACTDLELCHLINKQLPEEQQVSYRSFQRYKALVCDHSMVETHKKKMGDEYEIYKKLYDLWMDARIDQKIKLIEKIEEQKDGWQRYKWLLERKFRDFAGKPAPLEDETSEKLEPSLLDKMIAEQIDYAIRAALRNSQTAGNTQPVPQRKVV